MYLYAFLIVKRSRGKGRKFQSFWTWRNEMWNKQSYLWLASKVKWEVSFDLIHTHMSACLIKYNELRLSYLFQRFLNMDYNVIFVNSIYCLRYRDLAVATMTEKIQKMERELRNSHTEYDKAIADLHVR